MTTFGVSCVRCGMAIEDSEVYRFVNMKTIGFHVVFRCACGEEITDKHVARCTLDVARKMLDEHKAKVAP